MQEAPTNSAGAPVGYSGSVSNNGQDCSSCHSSVVNFDSQSPILTIESDIGDYYLPGDTYQFTISIDADFYESFGFLATIENTSGANMGEILLIDPLQTQLLAEGDYITHTNAGTVGIGYKSWSFNWVAPQFLQGDITIYVSSVLSNDNGTNQGDGVLTTSQTYQAAFLGCVDPQAVNYNSFATVDNATCLYGYSNGNSSLSLSFDSLRVYGTSNDFELELGINVHNNAASAKTVFVERNIITNNSPVNWFCWSSCYLPMVDVSPTGLTLESNTFTSNFSAHLSPYENVGNYQIEYCFYTENNINDSICATVEFIVEGEVLGCTNSNALNYDFHANTDDGSCIAYPNPNWEYSSNQSIFYHTIELPNSSEILIDGEQIVPGDWVGVFYETEDGLVCAGLSEWNLGSNSILAYAFDSTLSTGFDNGQSFVWQIWDASEGVSWLMNVNYNNNYPNSGSFYNQGVSEVIEMTNISPVSQQDIALESGWSLFSTYIITSNMNVVDVFEEHQEQLIIIKDNEGLAYLVAYNYNAIGDLIPGQAYLVKTTSQVNLQLQGAHAKPDIHPIQLQEGWNMIGYLNTSSENTIMVFSDLVNQNKIQIVKDGFGNAYLPDWGFNGIGDMSPGYGYQVKTYSNCVLQY